MFIQRAVSNVGQVYLNPKRILSSFPPDSSSITRLSRRLSPALDPIEAGYREKRRYHAGFRDLMAIETLVFLLFCFNHIVPTLHIVSTRCLVGFSPHLCFACVIVPTPPVPRTMPNDWFSNRLLQSRVICDIHVSKAYFFPPSNQVGLRCPSREHISCLHVFFVHNLTGICCVCVLSYLVV